MSKSIDAEKRLFKRLLDFHHDLVHAEKCAMQIICRELHKASNKADKELLECLNTALIVSYWSPFSKTRRSSAMPDSMLKCFSKSMSDLHNEIGNYRNHDHAHSDPNSRSIIIKVESYNDQPVATPTGRDPFIPISVKKTKTLLQMIKMLLNQIEKEQERIRKNFTIGDTF